MANVEDGAFDDGAYDGVEWNEAASFYANRNGNANGNYNYYVSAQLRIEFGTSGAILTKEKLISFSLDVFDMAGSTTALVGEVLLLIIRLLAKIALRDSFKGGRHVRR